MKEVWKGVLIGGAVGAAVAGVQASRTETADGTSSPRGPRLAKAAGEAALVGGAVGFLLDRRDKSRLGRTKRARKKLQKRAMKLEAALPVIQHAAEVAARRAADAADAARPHVQHAADVARPHMQHAADVARARAADAADAARPHVQAAAEAARRRASEAADSTLRAIAERDGSVIVAV
jgi:hypothetical protein